MDYSLLVGVYNLDQAAREKVCCYLSLFVPTLHTSARRTGHGSKVVQQCLFSRRSMTKGVLLSQFVCNYGAHQCQENWTW